MSAVTLDHDWYPRPIPPNVAVGARSWVYSSFAFLHCRSGRSPAVRIGSDTGVYDGTFFELGPDGRVEIGDFCTIVGAIVCTNGKIAIGDYAFVAHEVTIADCFAAVPPTDAGFTARPGAGIEIGENTWIGARAVVLGGARIGEGSIVGAAGVVDFEVPPYSVVAGNPGRVVGSVPR